VKSPSARGLLIASALVGMSCARQGRIPGGPADRVPPIVVAVEPEPESIAHDWDGPIRIHFNERISERGAQGALEDAILVSPAVEGLRVAHSRTGLEISVPGGFEEGRIYRVTVLPEISDLFANRMRGPFEFVFSTGPAISGAVAAGVVEDRLTGQPVQVRVEVVGPDSTVHFTRTGADGLFALRYLPPARYRLRAYEDRNRNGEPDFSEPQGGLPIALPSNADTSITSFSVLLPDSTPATLLRAEVVDSVSIRLEFDDYLDPAENVSLVGVGVSPDTAIADSLRPESLLATPGLDRVMHEHEFQEYQSQVAQLRATQAAEAARRGADSIAAIPDSTRAVLAPATPAQTEPQPLPVEEEEEPQEEEPQEEGPPLPGQVLVVILDSPLQARYPYRIRVTGVRNINALPLGGGSLGLVWNPPDPEPPQADSLGVGEEAVVVDTLQPGTPSVHDP